MTDAERKAIRRHPDDPKTSPERGVDPNSIMSRWICPWVIAIGILAALMDLAQ